MTNKEILDDFRSKYQITVSDYRPLCAEFAENMEGITIWTDEGDVILYFPKQRLKGRWKPCESVKDLPPSGTACFVTVERNGEKSVCISTFDHGTGWSNLECGERVISWIKLPEPWGGEQDGSD